MNKSQAYILNNPNEMRMRKVSNVHFIGIGGSGMCGIAEILHNQGYTVSGSDIYKSENCYRLDKIGIKIYYGHQESNVKDSDVVVISTAIDKSNNPEFLYSQENKIPIIPRAEMLAELMRYKYGVAIAGTHGKTTTTSMLSTIMSYAKLDPTFVIGGLLNSASSNAYLGKSKFFVAEADESDASFLHLQSQISIVTNIERDHMQTYDNSTEKMLDTYVQFLHNLPFYGLAILCGDDEMIQRIIPTISRPILTYGFEEKCDYQIINYRQVNTKGYFQVKTPSLDVLNVAIEQPGEHNALNATACIVVAQEIGINNTTILQALESFCGVGRRFEVFDNIKISSDKNITLVDDYGHHPTEVGKTITAARQAWPNRRIVLLFQPHRYSRTRDLYEDFINVLSNCDLLLLMDVYSAGEMRLEAADSKSLAGSIRARGKMDPLYIPLIDEVYTTISSVIRDNDILITQGAGDISKISNSIKTYKEEK